MIEEKQPMTPPHGSQRLKVLVFLFAAVFIAFLYTFLHESGHALVGVLAGGTVDAFNVSFWNLDAHVAVSGSLTLAQTVANNLAGAALPLLVWLGFILLVPKRANFAIECMKVFGSVMFLSTLLAWVFLPIRFLAGPVPGDDVTNFLNNSGVYPLWVTFAALLLFIGGWLLFGTKIDGLRREIDLFRQVDGELITPQVRKTLFQMAGLLMVCMLAAFGINGFRLSAPRVDSNQPPSDYSLVAAVDLSEEAYDQSAVYTFTLDAPGAVGIYLLVEDIQSEYFEVKLSGPNAYERQIIHAEGYTAKKDTPHIETRLQPGQYACVLTSRQSKGVVSIYAKGTAK
jgi:hypothetical protein